ncbi:MAG: helix-turn-helix domain-containing protein [Treponema sp.]|nr:helix-turn-helix domain-containing protein [Treponema sp.]
MTEKELHAIFSANIKKRRNNVRWTQAALAKEAGTSVNFINDIETEKKWASPATMVKIANALQVEVYELLRPPLLFPDNLDSIIKKYTDDMHSAIEQTRADFMKESMF